VSLLDLPDGIHDAVPNAVYHAKHLGLVSKGALDLMHKSPAHYKAWIDGELEDEDTPALMFGRAFHCAILEPDRFGAEYVFQPDFGRLCKHDASGTTKEQGKANKVRREKWLEENEGKVVLAPEDVHRIHCMSRKLRAHPLASRILREGVNEQTLLWTDEETGLRCRARPDKLVTRLEMLADLKSCADASPEAFRRDVAKYRYHVQNAHYRAGCQALGIEIKHFVFVCCEKDPPYNVKCYSVRPASVERGYESVRRDMRIMARSLAIGDWPGYVEWDDAIASPVGWSIGAYNDSIVEVDLPTWSE
jgi:hypothetical protein